MINLPKRLTLDDMRWYVSYAIIVVLILYLWIASYTQSGKVSVTLGATRAAMVASGDGHLKIGRYERVVTGLGEGQGEVGRDIELRPGAYDQVRFTQSTSLPQWPPIQRASISTSENVLYENGVVLTVRETTKVTGIAWWMIFTPLAIPLLLPVVFSKQRIRKKRRQAGLCPNCGYDVRATPSRCPECGWGHS